MNTRLISILVILVLGFLQPIATPAARAALRADLEGPANNQPVSGIGIIRGWAFSDAAGVRINQATLRIDGKDVTAIPCCSVRADVQNAFPQYPAENTRNSGFGITFNYGNLTAGAHTIAVIIQDSSGARFERAHAVTVVKAGDFSYIDQVNLNGASAERQGQDVVIAGLRVRDKASQQEKRVNARLRWFQNTQALGLVETATASAAPTATPENGRAPLAEKVQPTRAAASIQYAALESPNHGDTGAGIAVVRGWAVAPTGRTIQRVQLFVDGKPAMTIPCCSHRSDVAAALPGEPNAANSGFGVTFNYGNLTAGVHSMTVEIEDSSGALRKFVRGILVRNPGDFSFLEQLDLGNAQVRIAGGQLVIESALARDKATGKTAQRNLRFHWNTPAQAFTLTEDSVQDVTVADLTCKVDGDTSSLENLKRNPGPSGISLVEAITVINKAGAGSGRVFVGFEREGGITCSDNIVYGIYEPISINGDINGDDVPDIKIQGDGSAFKVRGNDVTIQQMAFLGFKANSNFDPIEISGSNTNVAVLNNQMINGGDAIYTDYYTVGTVKNFLIVNNYLSGFENGINIRLSKAKSSLENIIVAGNRIENSYHNSIIAELDKATDAIISGFNVIDNFIKAGPIGLDTYGPTGDSVIDTVIIGNQMIDIGNAAISLSSDKTMLAEIRDNIISSSPYGDYHVRVFGGNLTQSLVEGNRFSDALFKSIAVSGSNNHTVMADIRNNNFVLSGSNATGIDLSSGLQSQAVVKISSNNILHKNSGGSSSINIFGGNSKGFIKSEVKNNKLSIQSANGQSTIFTDGVNIKGGVNSNDNLIDTLIANNEINGFRNGIDVNGGFSDKNESRKNFVSTELASNLVDEINSKLGGKGINILGGDRIPGGGIVVDNEVQANVVNNITDSIVCKDNIPGNTAKCTLSGNTGDSGGVKSAQAGYLTGMSRSAQQQFATHREEIGVKEQQLRERAATLSDPRLQKRLLDLSDRLYEMQHKMSARMAGVPLSALSDQMEQ